MTVIFNPKPRWIAVITVIIRKKTLESPPCISVIIFAEMVLPRKYFRLHFRGFMLVVVVLFVDQFCDGLVHSIHEKLWPTSANCLCSQIQFWFPLHIYLIDNKLQIPTRASILVFPRIQPFRSDDFSSLATVYSRHVTGSADCRNLSVCIVMKNCPTSTVVRNPASVQNWLTRFCCDGLSSRSWYFCNRSSCKKSSVESVGVLINELVCTNNGSDCPVKTTLTVLTWKTMYSSHKSETAPSRLSWFTEVFENSFNLFTINAQVYWQFSTSSAFERSS